MARVVWNKAAERQLLHSQTGPVGQHLRRSAARVERRAQQLCPVDTGQLRQSINASSGTDEQGMYADVGTDVSYALHVELGTRPHVIEPRDKQALHWPGAAHPVKRVQHPGTQAQPYLRPALDVLRGE